MNSNRNYGFVLLRSYLDDSQRHFDLEECPAVSLLKFTFCRRLLSSCRCWSIFIHSICWRICNVCDGEWKFRKMSIIIGSSQECLFNEFPSSPGRCLWPDGNQYHSGGKRRQNEIDLNLLWNNRKCDYSLRERILTCEVFAYTLRVVYISNRFGIL